MNALTKREALAALLSQPDADDLKTAEGKTRGHVQIYDQPDGQVSNHYIWFRALKGKTKTA